MFTQSFEIKVAILGYVSVGKTTVLNALFQGKFSEVSMRRTTAAINMFRISTRKQDITKEDTAADATCTDGWSPDKGEPQTASSTLKETMADNKILRTANVIKEKTFDIQLDEPLCEMRPDTSLVIVDVPGLNEAGSSDMYKGYVEQQWDTYDCVVVIMDAEKGVNTDEQVSLLEFVKMKQQRSKDIPVIVLCNKVDDPSNEEIAVMVNEVREKVEEVFNVDCRSATLEKILNPSSTPDEASPKPTASSDSGAIQPPSFISSTSTSGKGKEDSISSSPVKDPSKPPPQPSPFSFEGTGWATSTSAVPNPEGMSTRNEAPAYPSGSSPFNAFPSASFGASHSSKTPVFSMGANNGQATAAKRSAQRKSGPTRPSFVFAKDSQTPFCFSYPTGIQASSPVLFLPISAENAFVYRTVSHLPLKEYKKLDKDIIERLGQEEAGRMRWRAMTIEEKHSVVHAVVSDPSAYKERLESTNFDRFLKILNHCVGGVDTQMKILETQLDVAIRKVERGEEGIAVQLRSIYDRSKVLGKPTNHLTSTFWSVYKTVEDKAFASFRQNLSLGPLHRCMNELHKYAKVENQIIHADGATVTAIAEREKVLLAAKNLVKHQCMIIVENASNWSIEASSFMTVGVLEISGRHNDGRTSQISFRSPIGGRQSCSLQPGASEAMPKQHPFYWKLASGVAPDSSLPMWINNFTGRNMHSKKNPDLPPISWTNLSPDDWMTIANSILILLHNTHFAQNFGREANELDLMKAFGMSLGRGGDVRKNYLAGAYVNGVFTPSDPTKYSLVRQVEMPVSPADEQHWGHLAWMFCQFKQDLEG
jgi:GTPase Era involved in 16S rRNA processing